MIDGDEGIYNDRIIMSGREEYIFVWRYKYYSPLPSAHQRFYLIEAEQQLQYSHVMYHGKKQ